MKKNGHNDAPRPATSTTVGVVCESGADERRVALVPDRIALNGIEDAFQKMHSGEVLRSVVVF